MDTLTIDPQVFATVVTAGVAVFAPVVHRMSDRTAENRRRRAIDDASALLAFYRDWNTLNAQLAALPNADTAAVMMNRSNELDQHIVRTCVSSRPQSLDSTSLLSRVPLPHPAESALAWMLHTLYYLLILIFIWDVSSTIIGVATEATLEDALLGIAGGFIFATVGITIIVGIRWVINRVDGAAMVRATGPLPTGSDSAVVG